MANKEATTKKGDGRGASGLFIPGGLLLGMGLGFVYGNVPAGLFIGLGAGFVLMALTLIFLRKKH